MAAQMTPLDALGLSSLAYKFEASNSLMRHKLAAGGVVRQMFLAERTSPAESLQTGGDFTHDLRVIFGTQKASFLHQRGWKLLTSTVEFMDADSTATKGYLAVYFVHPATHTLVAAHRGTVPPSIFSSADFANFQSNIQDDIAILDSQKPIDEKATLPILGTAFRFMIFALSQLTEPHCIVQTGHSLGGFIAEYLSARLHSAMPALGSSSSAFTFDSLGARPVLEYLGFAANPATTNYFLQPNIPNTANSHDGQLVHLADAGTPAPATAAALALPVHLHFDNKEEFVQSFLSHQLDAFETSFSNATGLPIVSTVLEDWPVATNGFTYGVYYPAVDASHSGSIFISLFANQTTSVTSMTHNRPGMNLQTE